MQATTGRMRSLFLPICINLLALKLLGQDLDSKPRLAGIINLSGETHVVLEERPQSMPFPLKVGEQLGAFEVLKILPKEGMAVCSAHGTNLTLSLERPGASEISGLLLEKVDLKLLLLLLGEFSHHTIIPFPPIPPYKVNLSTNVANQQEAADALEQALAQQGLVTIPDGKKFLLVLPKSKASFTQPHAPREDAQSRNPADNEIIPAGTIDFRHSPPITDKI